MPGFRLDPNNFVIIPAEVAAEAAVSFASAEEFASLAVGWPLSRLVAIWNTLPGVTPVNRFTDRKTAVARIWRALVEASGEHTGDLPARCSGRRPRKPLARPESKKARVISLLHQRHGVTLREIMAATGWQAHTVRAFLSRSLARQAQLKITSSRRPDGKRVYHVRGR
jgi:hypothetical protein